MLRTLAAMAVLSALAACQAGPEDQLRAQTAFFLRGCNVDVDLAELTNSEVTSIYFALSDGDERSRGNKCNKVEAILRNREAP